MEEVGHEKPNIRLSMIESDTVHAAYNSAKNPTQFLKDDDPAATTIVEETVRRLFQIFGFLAEAITYLHSQRVWHRR